MAPSNLRILHTISSLRAKDGGPARTVPRLALAQHALGHQTILWSEHELPTSLPDLPRELPAGFRLLTGPLTRIWDQFAPDIVHDHGIWLSCNRLVARECRKLGVPRVVSPRGMLRPWAMSHKRFKKKIAWWLYQERQLHQAAALHATSEDEARELESLGFRHRVFMAPNPVDIPARQHLIALPRATNGAVRTALFIGRIHPVKGLLNLVEAWRRVQPTGWRMLVVGPDEGGHQAEVREAVLRAGLSDSWEFAGNLEGDLKWRVLMESELLILPSFTENFGVVVAEALGVGLPVIASTGTPWGGVKEHGCGWQVEPSAEGLARALSVATSLPAADLRRMGQNGTVWVAASFTSAGVAETVVENYRRILDAEASPVQPPE